MNADGTITHVEMYDKPTSVSLRKVDPDGNDIKGAVMQLLDKDGNVVEEWTTDGNAHVLTAQLIAGETYTLHEKSAPQDTNWQRIRPLRFRMTARSQLL